MKLGENMKKGFLRENFFLYNVIFYQMLILFKFLKISPLNRSGPRMEPKGTPLVTSVQSLKEPFIEIFCCLLH